MTRVGPPSFLSALPVVAMAVGAGRAESVTAGAGVSGPVLRREIWRRPLRGIVRNSPRWSRTLGVPHHLDRPRILTFLNNLVRYPFNLIYQYGHLGRREWAAVFLGESGHQRPTPSRRDDLLHRLQRHDGPEQRVIQRRRRPRLAVGAVTAGAF